MELTATDFEVIATESLIDAVITAQSAAPAGWATDTTARLIGQWISDKLGGVSVVVENKPGGGANIGTESVLRSAPGMV
mgnify:CR=1 FL=1